VKFCSDCGHPVESKALDGAERFVCQNTKCQSVQWNNPVPVVAALVKHEGKYILARNARWPSGIFSLITGYLEAGEEVEQAVLREVEEELGLKGVIAHYLGHYIFREKNQLLLAFEIDAVGTLAINAALAEISRVSAEELTIYDFGPL